MRSLLSKLTIYSIALFYSCNAFAHPNHLFEIQNEIAHSHAGIEYLIVFISILGLVLAYNKFK